MRAMNVSSNTIEKLKQVWNVWNLRGFILFSFSLQCILIVGSSLRIQTSRTWVHRFIWLVYLLADWAAYYAIGLVVPVDRLKSDSEYTSDIHAFWAPFLLLHIGGPNTIAGFSLEDNELWDRSVLHIVVQAGATGIAIYRALSKQELLAPTLLVFIAAFTRYVGRVLALSKGSLDDLRDSISSNERTNNEQGDGSTSSSSNQVEQMVAGSYKLFQEYKGVFCGLSIRTNGKVMENRKRLFALKAEEAFTEMEIQVGLAYDLFYTKIWTIIENKLGKILHIISLSSEVGALVLWAFANKHGYHKVDIQLTNTLLIGGIVVDVASTLKLTLSDLVIYHLSKCFPNSPILGCVLSAKKPDRGKLFVLLRRWSGSIKQFELMRWDESISISNYTVKLLQRITGYEKGVSRVKLTPMVKNHIIKNIRNRALRLDSKNDHQIQKQRSIELFEYVLGLYDQRELLANAMRQICKHLGFVDALLVFHIATHFHYSDRKDKEEDQGNIYQLFNIQISNYLMYLLYYQPKMMLEGAELDMTVEDMTTHLKKIKEEISECKVSVSSDQWNAYRFDEEQETRLLATQNVELDNIFNTPVRGEEISVELISETARYIMAILRGGLYEQTVSDIWIDFLLYAAVHCKARTHVQQLGNGGQLLTIVWLMMAHLGLKIKLCD